VLQLLGVDVLFRVRRIAFGLQIEIREDFATPQRSSLHLMVDRIDHGMQFHDAERRNPNRLPWERMPTTYYYPKGPIGIAFSKLEGRPFEDQASDVIPVALLVAAAVPGPAAPLPSLGGLWSQPPVGVVTLNSGTVAGYVRPLQTIDFYESDPRIIDLAGKDPGKRKFTYVDDAEKRGATVRIFSGNERKTFDAEAPKQFYHLMVVDIARGDSVSTELMTKEAMKSFFDASVDEGVVCFHTSHRYYDLNLVVASVADSLGFAHAIYIDAPDFRKSQETGHYSSEWVLVARKQQYLPQRLRPENREPFDPRDAGFARGLRIERARPVRELAWTDAGYRSLSQIDRHRTPIGD
jgi:hypothetical protein